MELGRVLEPQKDFRERLLFVRGLYHEEARKGNIHSSQTGNMLSGAPITSGGEIKSGTSFDQMLAQTYGRSTKVPSLVLHCSSMMVGAKHNNDELPIIVLGGAGGRLKTGRTLDYKEKPERQLCRLFMSMMDKMEVRPKTFGGAQKMLEEV